MTTAQTLSVLASLDTPRVRGHLSCARMFAEKAKDAFSAGDADTARTCASLAFDHACLVAGGVRRRIRYGNAHFTVLVHVI